MAKKKTTLSGKRVTTLFIRDTQITLLVMTGGRIEKWASLPLERGLVSQGLIADEAQVADKVKQLFKQAGAQTDKVIIALSGHDSLYRTITLPDLPDAILPEAIKREAKRTIPTPLEDVYFSYQRLPSPKGESQVFLVTFPRNLVDALIRTLRQAGVKPYIMDLAPLAVCRIPDEPRAIVVNVRLEHLDVMVITERRPQVIRRLSMPSETESLEEKMPLITEEFNRTVSFYNSSHIEKPLDSNVPVFVCGDLAEAPDTWESLVGRSGYSVSPLPSPVESPEGFNPNEFMVNIGLALKELLPAKEDAHFSIVNFNALPEAYLPEHVSILRILTPVGIVVGIGLIIFGLIFVQTSRAYTEKLSSDVDLVKSSVNQRQMEIAALKAEIGPLEAIANELNNTITNMERGRATMYEDLTQVVQMASEQVQLSGVSHGGSSVILNGVASNEDAIFNYARNLRSGGRFSTVLISSISQSETGFNFVIHLAK